MVFNSRNFDVPPGQIVFEDRFRQVQIGIAFKKLTCYRCSFVGFYKYRVQEVRRHPEIVQSAEEEIRPDHVEIWKAIPRYAEIPETVKCKRCREVLGIYPSCIA